MKKFWIVAGLALALMSCEEQPVAPEVSLKEQLSKGIYILPEYSREIRTITSLPDSAQLSKQIKFVDDSIQVWPAAFLTLQGLEGSQAGDNARQFAIEATLGEEVLFTSEAITIVDFYGQFESSMMLEALVMDSTSTALKTYTIWINKGGLDLSVKDTYMSTQQDTLIRMIDYIDYTHFTIDESQTQSPAASDTTTTN